MKILKIKRCVECPKFKSCKHHNAKSRVFIMTSPNAVDIHPKCNLEDFYSQQQTLDAIFEQMVKYFETDKFSIDEKNAINGFVYWVQKQHQA